MSVFQKDGFLNIEKERLRFDDDKMPMLVGGIAELARDDMPASTVVNLGNLVRETEFVQSPFVIGSILFLCAGLTSWVLLIVSLSQHGQWHWTVLFGIIGLHLSLIVMLAAPLWHAYRTCRPSKYLNGQIWNFLIQQEGATSIPSKFTFMRTWSQAKDGVHQTLHFCGDVSYLSKMWFKALMMLVSATCAVSYICQYAVLKGADTTPAAIWIAVQAAFAFLRVLIWIFDPPFDDPRSSHAEYMAFSNNDFPDFSPIRIISDFLGDGKTDFEDNLSLSLVRRTMKIPLWALQYFQENDFTQIIQNSKPQYSYDVPQALPSEQLLVGPSNLEPQASKDSKQSDRVVVNNEPMTAYYIPETSLSFLLERRLEQFAGLDQPPINLIYLEKACRLELRLMLLRLTTSASHRVQPVTLMDYDKPLRDVTVSSKSMTPWRHGRFPPLSLTWLPIPAACDVKSWRSQAKPNSGDSQNVTCSIAEIVDTPQDYKIGLSSIIISTWLDSFSGAIQPEVLTAMNDFLQFDFTSLGPTPSCEDPNIIIDVRYVPLSRSWAIWRAATPASEPRPKKWLENSIEDFDQPVLRKQNKGMFVLDFKTSQRAMRFASEYLGYKKEARAIRYLKRANELAVRLRNMRRRASALTKLPFWHLEKYLALPFDIIFVALDILVTGVEKVASRALQHSNELDLSDVVVTLDSIKHPT